MSCSSSSCSSSAVVAPLLSSSLTASGTNEYRTLQGGTEPESTSTAGFSLDSSNLPLLRGTALSLDNSGPSEAGPISAFEQFTGFGHTKHKSNEIQSSSLFQSKQSLQSQQQQYKLSPVPFHLSPSSFISFSSISTLISKLSHVLYEQHIDYTVENCEFVRIKAFLQEHFDNIDFYINFFENGNEIIIEFQHRKGSIVLFHNIITRLQSQLSDVIKGNYQNQQIYEINDLSPPSLTSLSSSPNSMINEDELDAMVFQEMYNNQAKSDRFHAKYDALNAAVKLAPKTVTEKQIQSLVDVLNTSTKSSAANEEIQHSASILFSELISTKGVNQLIKSLEMSDILTWAVKTLSSTSSENHYRQLETQRRLISGLCNAFKADKLEMIRLSQKIALSDSNLQLQPIASTLSTVQDKRLHESAQQLLTLLKSH